MYCKTFKFHAWLLMACNVPENTAYPESHVSLPVEQLLEILQDQNGKKAVVLHCSCTGNSKSCSLDVGSSLRERFYPKTEE